MHDSLLIILSSGETQICFQSLEVKKPEYAKPFLVSSLPRLTAVLQVLQVPEGPARRAFQPGPTGANQTFLISAEPTQASVR